MFVKIINTQEEVKNGIFSNKTYDCKKYKIYPGENDTKVSLLIDVGEQIDRSMMLDKENTIIIIMNNNGKTVDKYSW